MTTQASTTGPTYAGESASPVTGSRQIGSSTPASIARASEVGIRAIRSPSAGISPVRTISTPVTTNAPTAAAQPPVTAPVETSSAAPGVDQASVIGVRCRTASQSMPSAWVTRRVEQAGRRLGGARADGGQAGEHHDERAAGADDRRDDAGADRRALVLCRLLVWDMADSVL